MVDEPPVSMTATHFSPTMKPMLAISSCPGTSSANCLPKCTKTLGLGSRRLKPLRRSAANAIGQASSQMAMCGLAAPIGRGVVCLRFRIDRIDRDGQRQGNAGSDSQRRILAQGNAGFRIEQHTAAGIYPDVRNVVSRNGISGD